MLSADELNDFRERLLDLETRVRGDYEHLTDEALDLQVDSRSPTHMAELGSDAYEQELTLRVAESDERILDAIHSALQRIEEGTYGICQGCVGKGKSPTKAVIPKRRLREIPYASNCVECERSLEGNPPSESP